MLKLGSHQDTQVRAAFSGAMEDARRAGLLDGDKTEHLSFRVPPGLLDEARRQTGLSSPTELGIAALAMLAIPDPMSVFMRGDSRAVWRGFKKLKPDAWLWMLIALYVP